MSSNNSSKESFADQPDDAHPAALRAPDDDAPAAEVPAARTEPAPESSEPTSEPERGESSAPERKIERTRASGMWVGAIVAAIVMVLLLVFILQNLDPVDIQLLTFHFSMPLGVALLLAALSAILVVAIPGAIRIMQLRKKVR